MTKTDFAALTRSANEAAEKACPSISGRMSFAAGWELANLREIIRGLELRIEQLAPTASKPIDRSSANELSDLIADELFDSSDMIAAHLVYPSHGPITLDRKTLIDGSEWAIEVSISAEMTIPPDRTCHRCHGCGEGWSEGSRCEICGGSGVEPEVCDED